MTFENAHTVETSFSNEQACVTYLFRKRWPWGFKCPFCGTVQQEMAPAYAVVCRYCRKQTSITAHTLMHGSKKSLVSWMRVAWQFCFNGDGISARELQRLMELSCYQTAWGWLQKMRRGAAIAESTPCRDIVLFDMVSSQSKGPSGTIAPDIGMVLELSLSASARVRFTKLDSNSPLVITNAINNMVEESATLLIKDSELLADHCRIGPDHLGQPTGEQLERGQLLQEKTVNWLTTIYRRAIAPSHMQSYLDEFSFRHNTASWPDRRVILDHLITGLLSTDANTAVIEPREVEEETYE
ncbi:transposase [Desulforhopalus sp. 52FAK]